MFILLICLLLMGCQLASAIDAPTGLVAAGGDQSVILHWDRNMGPNLAGYRIYRSTNGGAGPFTLLNSSLIASAGYCDLSAAAVDGRTNFYRVSAVDLNSDESAPSAEIVGVAPHVFANDDAFLDYVQEANFDYFWYMSNPTNGLVPDRSAAESPCSIAAVGFGLTSIGVGIDHGWITRAQGAARALTTLTTFWQGPQNAGSSAVMGYEGWFYHFLDMNTGLRASGCELSTIDTALFLAGALYARQYFNGATSQEATIRSLAGAIFNRVNWQFMAQPDGAVAMAWQPNTGFNGYGSWIGYNEAMVLYCLGLGTATNPLPSSAWNVWTSGYQWATNYGQAYVSFAPLFGHFFSHCWIDFRHIADTYMNGHNSTYFENSRRAALAEVAYSSTAPHTGYNSFIWGLTACDGPAPDGYLARGLPPAATDDGTIAPTAAGGAVCFTPEKSVPALERMYYTYRTNLWTENGFRDAFNLGQGWFDSDELGIDQGPIVLMIENYRTQNIWRLFKQTPEVQRGLQRAGFVALPPVALNLQHSPTQRAYDLSWNPSSSNRFYQVEYSPDLFSWLVSPGLVQATNTKPLNWQDKGPPSTVSPPASAPQRFYEVFQLGIP